MTEKKEEVESKVCEDVDGKVNKIRPYPEPNI
jgi:hypothetical protein